MNRRVFDQAKAGAYKNGLLANPVPQRKTGIMADHYTVECVCSSVRLGLKGEPLFTSSAMDQRIVDIDDAFSKRP